MPNCPLSPMPKPQLLPPCPPPDASELPSAWPPMRRNTCPSAHRMDDRGRSKHANQRSARPIMAKYETAVPPPHFHPRRWSPTSWVRANSHANTRTHAHTHIRTQGNTHTRTHTNACAHARTHARARARTRYACTCTRQCTPMRRDMHAPAYPSHNTGKGGGFGGGRAGGAMPHSEQCDRRSRQPCVIRSAPRMCLTTPKAAQASRLRVGLMPPSGGCIAAVAIGVSRERDPSRLLSISTHTRASVMRPRPPSHLKIRKQLVVLFVQFDARIFG